MRRLSGSCQFQKILNIQHPNIIEIRPQDITCADVKGVESLVINLKKYDLSLDNYLEKKAAIGSVENFSVALIMIQKMIGSVFEILAPSQCSL